MRKVTLLLPPIILFSTVNAFAPAWVSQAMAQGNCKALLDELLSGKPGSGSYERAQELAKLYNAQCLGQRPTAPLQDLNQDRITCFFRNEGVISACNRLIASGRLAGQD